MAKGLRRVRTIGVSGFMYSAVSTILNEGDELKDMLLALMWIYLCATCEI